MVNISVPKILFLVDVDSNELTPSVWTNMVECRTGSKTRDGQKGSCHEKTEVVQFRIQTSSC
jgi:hypothetical protein